MGPGELAPLRPFEDDAEAMKQVIRGTRRPRAPGDDLHVPGETTSMCAVGVCSVVAPGQDGQRLPG
jgi:hypothetical protein